MGKLTFSPAKTHTFATLDMLRGLAAFAVMIGHSEESFNPFLSGLFAVDLFFVMSGFVIAHAYEHRLASGLSFSEFAVIRAVRLYPLYALGGVIGLFYIFLYTKISLFKLLITALSTTFMLPTPGSADSMLFPANGVAWSLFFEIIINMLYAATWRRWTIRALVAVCAITFVGLIICRITLLSFDIGWSWRNSIGGLARVCYGFPMGVLLYRLWKSQRLSLRVPLAVVLAATVLVLIPISQWGFVGPEREAYCVVPG